MHAICQLAVCSIALVSIALFSGCEQALTDLQMSYVMEASAPVENDETWGLIELQIDNGEYSKAFDNCNAMKEKYPQSAIPYFFQSALYYAQADFKNCLEACDRAIELEPSNVDLFVTRSEVLFEMGRSDLAIEAVSNAIEIDSSDSALYNDRGYFYERIGKFSEAAKDYLRALKLNPESFWATNNYASILCMSPNPHDRNGAKAVELGKELIKMAVWENDQRAYTYAWDTLASALAEQEEFGQAMRACQKALRTADAEERVGIEERMTLYKQNKPARYPLDGSHIESAAFGK